MSPVISDVSFCVHFKQEVNLTYTDVPTTLTVDKSFPPCDLRVTSFLGDHPNQERSTRDFDIFQFNGTAGHQVKLRLEADPQAGNNGGQAALRIKGKSVDQQRTGTLPLEITVPLGSMTTYDITVEEARVSPDQRYRGGYILTLESALGDIDTIRPTSSVEK